MSAMQSTAAASAAKAVRESEKNEPNKNNAVTGSSFSGYTSPGKQSVIIPRERPTTNPNYVPPERTSSLSFKAPATSSKPAKSAPEPPAGSQTFSALDYISFPVKFIASKFSSAPPPEPVKTKKFKIDLEPKHKDTKPYKTVEKPKVADRDVKSSVSAVTDSSALAMNVDTVAPTGDSASFKPVDGESPKGSSSPPAKTSSRSYTPSLAPRSLSPSVWKQLEKKRAPSPPSFDPKLLSANSVNISPANKISYKVTSKQKEEQVVKAKRDPRKIHKHNYKKSASLTSSKSPHRDIKVTRLSEKTEEINYPTFLRHAFPPSYTVKTVSSPDIPDRSNSASTDALSAEATTLFSSPSKTEQQVPPDLPNELRDRVHNLPIVLKPVVKDPDPEDVLIAMEGPTFLGPPTMLKVNKRSNSLLSFSSAKWKDMVQANPQNNRELTSVTPLPALSSTSVQSCSTQQAQPEEELQPTQLSDITPVPTPPEVRSCKRMKSFVVEKNVVRSVSSVDRFEKDNEPESEMADSCIEPAAGTALLTAPGACLTAVTTAAARRNSTTEAGDAIKSPHTKTLRPAEREKNEKERQSQNKKAGRQFNFKKKQSSKKSPSASKRKLSPKKSSSSHKRSPSYTNMGAYWKKPYPKKTQSDTKTAPSVETPSVTEVPAVTTMPTYTNAHPAKAAPNKPVSAPFKTSSSAKMESPRKSAPRIKTPITEKTLPDTNMASPTKTPSNTKVSNPKITSSQTRTSSPNKVSSQTRNSSPQKTSSQTRNSLPKKTSSQTRNSSPKKTSSQTRNSSPKKTSSHTRMLSPKKRLSQTKLSSPRKTSSHTKASSPRKTFSHTTASSLQKESSQTSIQSPAKVPPSTKPPSNSEIPSPPVPPSHMKMTSPSRKPQNLRNASPVKPPTQARTTSPSKASSPLKTPNSEETSSPTPRIASPIKTPSLSNVKSPLKAPAYSRTTSFIPSYTRAESPQKSSNYPVNAWSVKSASPRSTPDHRKKTKSRAKTKKSSSSKTPPPREVKYPTLLPFNINTVTPTLLPSFVTPPDSTTETQAHVESSDTQPNHAESKMPYDKMDPPLQVPATAPQESPTKAPADTQADFTTKPPVHTYTESPVKPPNFEPMESPAKPPIYIPMESPPKMPSNSQPESSSNTTAPATGKSESSTEPTSASTAQTSPTKERMTLSSKLGLVGPSYLKKIDENSRAKVADGESPDALKSYGGNPHKFVSAATMLGELP